MMARGPGHADHLASRRAAATPAHRAARHVELESASAWDVESAPVGFLVGGEASGTRGAGLDPSLHYHLCD